MKKLLCAFLLVCWMVLESCSPVNVISTNFQPSVKEHSYTTYNFYDVDVQAPDSMIPPDRIELLKNAISRQLEMRGLTKSESPDLWVNIGVMVEDKDQTRETTLREAPLYIGQRNYHWESEEIVVNTYKEGTVTIDLVDADTDSMVAQAVASSVIVDNEEQLKKRINKGMEKVFEEWWKNME